MTREEAIQVLNMVEAHGLADEAKRMAIEALSALPSTDAPYMFSEAYVEQLKFERDYLQDVVNGQWISCSERLPKEKARVLTYDTMGGIVFGQYDKGRWYWEAEACADYWARNDGVIAWMPLPKPYECGARMKGGDTK